MNKTKRLIEESILFAVNEVSKDIQNDTDTDENLKRSETIKTLAEAYAIVHWGKFYG